MIRTQTIFVVGAGASFELGLPTGDDLKNIISRLLDIRFEDGHSRSSGDPVITQALRRLATGDKTLSGNINPLLQKCWRIRDALPTAISIDNFLDAHRGDASMEMCGKFGIVRAILEAEKRSKLQVFLSGRREYSFSDVANTWYIPLFQLITENISKDDLATALKDVKFIIFNYDRCIEFFLPYVISNYYDIVIGEAERLVRNIEFIHPYGQTGYLPWQEGTPIVPFGADQYELSTISREIMTFTQGLRSPRLKRSISAAIYEAELIVFLGFAYHPINMSILSSDLAPPLLRKVFGTTYGLSKADEGVVEEDLLRIFQKRDPMDPVDLYEEEPSARLDALDLDGLTCFDFLRQYFRSIGSR